jgi:hypothetical protein
MVQTALVPATLHARTSTTSLLVLGVTHLVGSALNARLKPVGVATSRKFRPLAVSTTGASNARLGAPTQNDPWLSQIEAATRGANAWDEVPSTES